MNNKRPFAAALALSLYLTSAAPALAASRQSFTDVPTSHWAYSAVEFVVEHKIFNGTSSTTFAPELTMDRAMLVRVLYNYAGAPAVTGTVRSETPFTDVSDNAYYADALIWACQNELLPSWFFYHDSPGTTEQAQYLFQPTREMPRFDFAVLLQRFLINVLGQTSAGEETFDTACPLTDMGYEHACAALGERYPGYPCDGEDADTVQQALAWAYSAGVMKGTSATTMSPALSMTRAQAATMLGNLYQVCNTAPGTAEETPSTVDPFLAEVIRLVNLERAKEGLAPLTAHDKLTQAAGIRAQEIVSLFSHSRPDSSSCFTVMDELSISYRRAGENIAAGQTSPASVVDAWMNSPGHRANIMNPDFTHIGVGHTAINADRYGHYWVQLFMG